MLRNFKLSLFFGAYHFCSIKTVDLATNRCCQHHCWPPTRVLPTTDESVANQLFGQKMFAKKIFFFSWQQFWGKKYFVAKKIGKKIGWQHSRRGSTMTSTTSIGCQIHSFDATKMVCTKNKSQLTPVPKTIIDRSSIIMMIAIIDLDRSWSSFTVPQ